MVVDHQCHWFPPAYLELLARRTELPRAWRTPSGWIHEVVDGDALPIPEEHTDLDWVLGCADANGIDVLVIGPQTLSEFPHTVRGQELAELLEALHAAFAAAQREHPERLVFLAGMPVHDVDTGVAAIERAVSEHQLRGVSVLASNDGDPVASEATLPLYARVAALGLPVFLHPGIRTSTLGAKILTPDEAGLAWMFHTARAAVNLIDSGTLDALEDLTVVHPHLGGVLPYVWGRTAGLYRVVGRDTARPFDEYLRTRFYVDTVAATPGALRFALDLYGRERVLFGTDHPFVPMERVIDYVSANADPADVEQILANRLPGLALPAGG